MFLIQLFNFFLSKNDNKEEKALIPRINLTDDSISSVDFNNYDGVGQGFFIISFMGTYWNHFFSNSNVNYVDIVYGDIAYYCKIVSNETSFTPDYIESTITVEIIKRKEI